MSLESQAESFLAQKRIAIVGASRSNGTGKAIFKALRERGHEAIPVNPNADSIDGETCYPTLSAVPGGVGAAVIVTRPEVTDQVARECVEAGVQHVWMHHNSLFGAGSSSVSPDATAYLREHGVSVIPGGCPLMFGEKADAGHRCMRWLLGVMGKLPQPEA
jgi:acyl-CoA synthetase (NDP forming)